MKRIVLAKPLRGLLGVAAGWCLGWGFFRIVRDEVLFLGLTSIALGTALLVLGLMSGDRSKESGGPPTGQE